MTDLQSKLQHLNIHRSLTGQWKNKKQKDNYLSKNSEATKQKKKKKNIKLPLGNLHFISN